MAHRRKYRGGNTNTLSVSKPFDMAGHSMVMARDSLRKTFKHTGDIVKHTFNGIMDRVNKITTRPTTGGKTRRRRRFR